MRVHASAAPRLEVDTPPDPPNRGPRVCGERRPATLHAMFGPTTLGCFGSVEEAADTWDAEARRRGLRHVNQPGTGELSIIEAVRAIFASVTRLPLPPATYAWRAQRFAELMQSAHTGGIEAVWASSRDLQQALRSASCRVAHPTTPCHLDASRLRGQVDHASAAGTQLVISYQPHIFDTSKARSCEAGWQHAPPKPSVTAYFSRPECRARSGTYGRSFECWSSRWRRVHVAIDFRRQLGRFETSQLLDERVARLRLRPRRAHGTEGFLHTHAVCGDEKARYDGR